MGFLKRIKTPKVSMDKINSAYEELYEHKYAYYVAANSGNENEEQIEAIKFDKKYNEIVRKYDLSREEKRMLDEQLRYIMKEIDEKEKLR